MTTTADLEDRVIDDIGPMAFSDKYCPNSQQTFRICLNLKKLIDRVIAVEYKEEEITGLNSPVINDKVLKLAYKAAGGKGNGKPGTSSVKYQASLVFCLLRVCDWYWQQAEYELTDNYLYTLRAIAAQKLAVLIIDGTRNDELLFLGMLCHRYTIALNGVDAHPVSALELAVDMHSTIVMGSSGYQRCIRWLWRGWIIQSSIDPHSYVLYKGVNSLSIRSHFDPARVRTPLYQNILEVGFSFIYLVLYTIILNTNQEETKPLDVFEVLFYLFTVGLILDEAIKLYHIGFNYIRFWNVFNDLMYAILLVAIGFRLVSLHNVGHLRDRYDEMSFRILSCAAPFMWSRLLLFLDAQKFVGAMIVVLKVMMKESLIFFVMLGVVILGFLQGFLGLDASDGKSEATRRILVSLVKSVIGEASFDDVALLVPPYALIMYYIYSFLLLVILMNILIALYSTSYASIVENSTSEYFGLVAQKTLKYIRAPDEDLYVPPLNLIEILISPFSLVMSRSGYKALNYYVMLVIYLPLLCYIASVEIANARRIQYNRYKGLPDDANEYDADWDLTDGFDDDASADWAGMREQDDETRRRLADQRAGEQQDPEFAINQHDFEDDIECAVQPVERAKDAGIKWELFVLYAKMDELTRMVNELVEREREREKK